MILGRGMGMLVGLALLMSLFNINKMIDNDNQEDKG